jgi:secreted trypsin-like serine protease
LSINILKFLGGPLQITKYTKTSKKYFEIVGITSFGKFCSAGIPGVYVKVSSYLDWIESVVWK